jgi:hypothetical protein
MRKKVFNAGYLEELSWKKEVQNVVDIFDDTVGFNFFLKPYFADSFGFHPLENDVNYGGELYTDKDTSQLIVAYKIRGSFLATDVKEYYGFSRAFCFENKYQDRKLIPVRVKRVRKLTSKEVRKLHIVKYPVYSYVFVNCD